MTRLAQRAILSGLVLLSCFAAPAFAHPAARSKSSTSITDRSIVWPTTDQWLRVFLLKDYNTRVVILGTTMLGCAAGIVGSFTLLRKRALMGDALSHATLPGIGLAFIIATLLGMNGKSLLVLLTGATISGLVGVASILIIRNLTRLKEDAALGIVLSVFFGGGISLLGVIQQMEHGHAAGLEAFIYGKTASMGANDARLIGFAAVCCVGMCLILFKELKLLCFDEGYAGARGMPVLRLDLTLMALVVVISIVGLQAVGLVLMIALLVIPAAAARFWTERMWKMALISACLGAVGGLVGAGISALFYKLPSGAMIVLVCTTFFLFSMVFGSKRGILIRWWRRSQLNRAVDRQHLMRAMYELLESSGKANGDRTNKPHHVSIESLLTKRSWPLQRLRRGIRRAKFANLVSDDSDGVHFTREGFEEASSLTRQHRLWELYLITHADIAPSRVDRNADAIEHVLEPDIVAELEALLEKTPQAIPASPHELNSSLDSTRDRERSS